MKHLLRRWRLALLAAGCALLLSGCTLGNPVEELFVLPQLPPEYVGLSQALEELLSGGYEYLYPETGPNVEAVQMADLTGSGGREAVAFMRRSGDTNPLKIFVLSPDGDSYKRLCAIENRGAGVERVYYSDITGDGAAELIVGWRSSGDERTVTVYHIGAECLRLMNSVCTQFTIEDLNGDGVAELLVLHEDSAGTAAAELYRWESDILLPSAPVLLSSGVEDLHRGSIVSGALEDGTPAVFITGVSRDDAAVTDILIRRGRERLVNVTLDEETDRSELRYTYCGLLPQDLDGDGVTELPRRAENAGAADLFSSEGALVDWVQSDIRNVMWKEAMTYHDLGGGWYFDIPKVWWDRVAVSDSYAVNGEKCVTLYVDGVQVAALYAITSDNRESRAQIGGRFLITRLPSVIYAGELYGDAAWFGVDEEMLRAHFALTVSDWTPERSN